MACIAKSLWGVAEAGDKLRWDSMLERIKSSGFGAVESILIFDVNLDPKYFRELLDKYDLQLFIQLHTASDWSKFDYCASCDLQVHVASFRKLVQDSLMLRPTVINVHSGHDSWSHETAISYFEQVLAIEEELLVGEFKDVVLVHETHRQRLLFNPYQTRDILAHPTISGRLRLNCDLSHWVCVCEKLFNASDARDAWWPGVLETVANHCYLIHARVGHTEGPQVMDPRDPHCAAETEAHISWWRRIIECQRSRGVRTFITTEHGPEPYQVFDTPKPQPQDGRGGDGGGKLTDEEKNTILWDINVFVKDRIEQMLLEHASQHVARAGIGSV